MELMKRRFSFCSLKALVFIGGVCFSASAQQKLNHIQVIGTHNSYKVAIDKPVMDTLKKFNPKWAETLEYSHGPIEEQLNQGLGNLEIDIAVDRLGGNFAKPHFYEMYKDQVSPYNTAGEMNTPGFKVIHIQDLDFRSHCASLKDCLQILKNWSDAHPKHQPVFITMNAKSGISRGLPTVAEDFKPEDFKELNALLWSELGPKRLLIPKDVQGKYSTLEEAVLAKGWPDLKTVLGKFIFVLDEGGLKRSNYLGSQSPVQVMFTDSPVGDPNAAFLIMNNPIKQEHEIRDLVKKGYMVRTRADAETYEARREDYSRFEAACRSGAQVITTDYYLPSTHFKSNYKVNFEGNKYLRDNPIFKK
jgi:hypothetical protein